MYSSIKQQTEGDKKIHRELLVDEKKTAKLNAKVAYEVSDVVLSTGGHI